MVNMEKRNQQLKSELAERIVRDGLDLVIPPDPDNNNENRAGWAGSSIAHFCSLVGEDMEEEQELTLSDLLCDFMHWADRHEGVDFDAALERARGHYREETLP